MARHPLAAPFLLSLLAACATTDVRPASGGAPTASAEARLAAHPELAASLHARGLEGVVALRVHGEDSVRCSDTRGCIERSLPASTFKIVNTIVALETGVAPDASLSIPWDGVTRDFPGWNQDQTLQSAFDVSCVPYFQELARRIGLDRMRDAVHRFDYGNGEVGEMVDRFWLDGPLAISPVEQIAFLERFETGRLPITERTRTLAREVMVRERRGDAILRGKTGWSAPGTAEERGWFVGYATYEGRTTYVAVRATRASTVPDAVFRDGRMAAAIEALVSVGAYPAHP